MMPVIATQIVFVAAGALLVGMASFAAEPVTNSNTEAVITSSYTDATAYQHSVPLQDEKLQKLFSDGLDSLKQRWVMPFLPGGPWGRGPLSNGESCAECHINSGRGQAPLAADEPLRSMLVRLSVAGKDLNGGPLPHPIYGMQLNFQGVPGQVRSEGEAYLSWQENKVRFADGETVSLRTPTIELSKLGYGPLGDNVLLSARLAPPLIGMGLLEAIPASTIEDLANAEKPHGIKGKVNRVWDIAAQQLTLGRFGLKANQPNLVQQHSAAFHEDMGVTTQLFPTENCTAVQKTCREVVPVAQPEMLTNQFVPLLFYVGANAVPARRNVDDPDVKRGEALFQQAACGACHVPDIQTGGYGPIPQLSHQVIHPFSDLLLHDMGEALADGRPDFAATGSEWRTPPLWGLGLLQAVNDHTNLLHDGRARNATEAILWHGGEGNYSREAFLQMAKADRATLLKFLNSL